MKKKNKNKNIIKRLVVVFVLLLAVFVFATIALSLSQNESAKVFFALSALLLFFGLITLFTFIGYYNSLVRNKNKVDESFSLVDVYLKMRFDLVPNLVKCVKAYMEHEQDVLKQIVALRRKARKTGEEKDKVELSNQLAGYMEDIFVSIENYPDLKADKVFLKLIRQLRDIENKIAASRRFYNASINSYNNAVQSFPSNIIARSYDYSVLKPYIIDVNQKILPKVSLAE